MTNEAAVPVVPTKEQAAAAAANFAAELPDGKFQRVKLKLLRESDQNLRHVFAGIDELAATMENGIGVLVPLIVRPDPDKPGHFIIVGGARRFRAAKKAGVDEVPIDVRKLTDVQETETMLVENGQRDDLRPSEEADGFRRLKEDFHYSVAQIAAKVGKSKAHVHARIKLCSLCPEARKLLDTGVMDATVAVPLARRPHKVQADAIRRIYPKDAEPMTSRAALEFLTHEFTVTLKGAPFDQKDDMLVPLRMTGTPPVQIGGSCLKCPHRSGSVPGLFDDVQGHDTCTMPTCFDEKKRAQWKVASASAKERGLKVLGVAEAKGVFTNKNDVDPMGDYVLAGAPAANDPKKRTWKQLLKDEAIDLYFIPDRSMKGRECYRTDEALKLLKDQKWAKKTAKERADEGVTQSGPEEWKAEQQKREARRIAQDMLIDKAAADLSDFQLPHMRLIALALTENTNDQSAQSALERRQLDDKTAEKWITEKATGADLARFIYEVALGLRLGNPWQGFSEEAEALAKRLKFDLEQQATFQLEQLKAQAAQPAKEQPGSDDAKAGVA